MDKEIRQQAIDLQAPLFILANQRYDLPKQGLLETSDIKVLRALLEDEDDVERVVDSYYLDVLLDFACNPDNNWLKSCVLLHRFVSPSPAVCRQSNNFLKYKKHMFTE